MPSGGSDAAIIQSRGHDMGKYLVGWLLGVPVIVLVILYFFFH
jgi:Na+(H+)/acetate symporter ActP